MNKDLLISLTYKEYKKKNSTQLIQHFVKTKGKGTINITLTSGDIVTIEYVCRGQDKVKEYLGDNFRCTASNLLGKSVKVTEEELANLARGNRYIAGLEEKSTYGDRKNTQVFLVRLKFLACATDAQTFGR